MEETKFIIETTSRKEATLMSNALKMALIIEDLINFRRELYNNKSYDVRYLYDGKVYTTQEWFTLKRDYEKDKKEGKTVMTVLTDDDVIRKIDDILDGIEYLIYDCIE